LAAPVFGLRASAVFLAVDGRFFMGEFEPDMNGLSRRNSENRRRGRAYLPDPRRAGASLVELGDQFT
jgi:hypothetical protein